MSLDLGLTWIIPDYVLISRSLVTSASLMFPHWLTFTGFRDLTGISPGCHFFQPTETVYVWFRTHPEIWAEFTDRIWYSPCWIFLNYPGAVLRFHRLPESLLVSIWVLAILQGANWPLPSGWKPCNRKFIQCSSLFPSVYSSTIVLLLFAPHCLQVFY